MENKKGRKVIAKIIDIESGEILDDLCEGDRIIHPKDEE